MSLTNIVKGIGMMGLVLSPLACGAIAYEQVYREHPVEIYKKSESVMRSSVSMEYRAQDGMKDETVVLVDKATQREYRVVRADARKKGLVLEEVRQQRADRPYYEQDE